MRNECNIIRDLLPLYAKNMVTSDTADFLEEHLKGCEACRKEYERTKQPQTGQELSSDAAPLLNLNRKLKVKKVQTIAMTAVFVIALLVSAFAVLDAPIYFPYSEELVTLGQLDYEGMLLTFNKEVTDFSYTVYKDPDGGNLYYCDIEAWTSLWDKWFSQGKNNLSAVVTTDQTKPILAIYVANDQAEDVCIGKYDPKAENKIEKNVDYGNRITLPRLSLGYYFILAAIAMMIMAILWLFARKRAKWCLWTERIGLYPAAYMISHFIVSGSS